MASFDYNPITGQLDLVGSGGGTSYIDGDVEYHSNLPVTVGTPAVNSAFLVRKGEGLYFINRKPAGIWVRELNNGNLDDWKYAGTFSDLYRDANFRIINDADTSKELAFDVSGIATGTTRTITVPNKNITLDDAGDARTPSSTLAHASTHHTGGTDAIAPAQIGAEPAINASNRNIIYVSKGAVATDTRGSLSKYSATVPFATLLAAENAAAAGDLVVVEAGSYTGNTLGTKAGVNWHFCAGAIYTGPSTGGPCFSLSGLHSITGQGKFISGSPAMPGVIAQGASNVYLECLEIAGGEVGLECQGDIFARVGKISSATYDAIIMVPASAAKKQTIYVNEIDSQSDAIAFEGSNVTTHPIQVFVDRITTCNEYLINHESVAATSAVVKIGQSVASGNFSEPFYSSGLSANIKVILDTWPHSSFTVNSSVFKIVFVDRVGLPSTATPSALGTAAAGTSADYARADHVHAMPSAADVGAIEIGGVAEKAFALIDDANDAEAVRISEDDVIIANDYKSPFRTALGLGDAATADIGTGSTEVAAGDHSHELDELDATGATLGHVLTADGSNGASWQAASGGGVSAVNSTLADILSVSGSDLVADDLGSDKLYGWDDSESKAIGFTVSTGLETDGTNLKAKITSDPTGVTGADAITNIMSLTQAEYNAIGSPDAATLFLITDP